MKKLLAIVPAAVLVLGVAGSVQAEKRHARVRQRLWLRWRMAKLPL